MKRRSILRGAALLVAAPAVALAQASGAGTVARGFAAALNAHDIEAFAALFAADYINHQTSAAAPPPSAGTPPRAATVAFFAARLKGLPDLSVSIEAMVERDDRVAASFVYEGTHQGLYFGVAPTGKRGASFPNANRKPGQPQVESPNADALASSPRRLKTLTL